jgi:hypothetical protein
LSAFQSKICLDNADSKRRTGDGTLHIRCYSPLDKPKISKNFEINFQQA